MCICPRHRLLFPTQLSKLAQFKVKVPIESPLVVCYLTSFKSNIVYVTIFETFAAKITDLDLGRFKVIQGKSLWCQLIARERFPIRLLLTQSLYLPPFSQYLTCNCDDLEALKYASSRLSRIKVYRANRQPIGGFLSDLF